MGSWQVLPTPGQSGPESDGNEGVIPYYSELQNRNFILDISHPINFSKKNFFMLVL